MIIEKLNITDRIVYDYNLLLKSILNSNYGNNKIDLTRKIYNLVNGKKDNICLTDIELVRRLII